MRLPCCSSGLSVVMPTESTPFYSNCDDDIRVDRWICCVICFSWTGCCYVVFLWFSKDFNWLWHDCYPWKPFAHSPPSCDYCCFGHECSIHRIWIFGTRISPVTNYYPARPHRIEATESHALTDLQIYASAPRWMKNTSKVVEFRTAQNGEMWD